MIEIDADTRIRGFLKTLIERVESSEEAENYTEYDGNHGTLTIFVKINGARNVIGIDMEDAPRDMPDPIEWAVNMTGVTVSTPSTMTTHDLAIHSEAEACLARLRAMMSWGWL